MRDVNTDDLYGNEPREWAGRGSDAPTQRFPISSRTEERLVPRAVSGDVQKILKHAVIPPVLRPPEPPRRLHIPWLFLVGVVVVSLIAGAALVFIPRDSAKVAKQGQLTAGCAALTAISGRLQRDGVYPGSTGQGKLAAVLTEPYTNWLTARLDHAAKLQRTVSADTSVAVLAMMVASARLELDMGNPVQAQSSWRSFTVGLKRIERGCE